MPNFLSTMFFKRLINMMAISMFGPVTMHIRQFIKPGLAVHSQAINLSINPVTSNPVAFLNIDVYA